VRFSKTGADATSAAIRVARAFTDRERVVCCGYHGWHDWYIAVTDRAAGIPDEVKALSFTFNYNDLQSAADAIDDDTACVILEPMVFEAPKPGFLAGLKQLCAERGVLLVFDEMWTGFRWAIGGAQEAYGVTPDLATFSKAIANGMPLSVVCGRADVMKLCDKDVFFFTTFGGEALSLAAAQATIRELIDKKVPDHLHRMGKLLRDGLDATLAELSIDWVKCIGHDARTLVTFDAKAGDPLIMKSLAQQEMVKRGVLWSGFHTLSYSHGMDEIGYVLAAYRQILPILADAVAKKDAAARLRGKPVEPVFRRTSQFNMKPTRRERAKRE
jgi:glutamate-1-semialdehyde aminotransferase